MGGLFLRQQFPSLLPVYVLISVLVLIVWTSACISFARQRRLSAFLQLQMGSLIILLLGWPAAGSHIQLDAEAQWR